MELLLNIIYTVGLTIGVVISICIDIYRALPWWGLIILAGVCIGIIKLAIDLIRGIFEFIFDVIGGIIAGIFYLIMGIGIVIINFIYALHYVAIFLAVEIGFIWYQDVPISTELIIASLLAYIVVIAVEIKAESNNEIRAGLDKILADENIGMIISQEAENFMPFKSKMFYKMYIEQLKCKWCDKTTAVKHLEQKLSQGEIQKAVLIDGEEYYFVPEICNRLQEKYKNYTEQNLCALFKRHGIVEENEIKKLTENITQPLWSLKLSLFSYYKDNYLSERIKTGEVAEAAIARSVLNNKPKEKLFINKSFVQGLMERWQDKEIIKEKDVLAAKICQNRNEVVGFMNVLADSFPEFPFIFAGKDDVEINSYFWLNSKYKEKYTCRKCKKYFRKLTSYKNELYCPKCLKKVKQKEERLRAQSKNINSGVPIDGIDDDKNVTRTVKVVDYADIPPAMRKKLESQEKNKPKETMKKKIVKEDDVPLAIRQKIEKQNKEKRTAKTQKSKK